MRNLKVLGLALMAAMALSAVSASGAMAESFYHSEVMGETVAGHQVGINVFYTEVGEVECTTATVTGQPEEETTGTKWHKVKVTPVYSGCTLAGQAATVNTSECHYLFTTPTTTAGEWPWHAEVHIECTNGHEITVKKGTCEVKVPSQTPTNPLVDLKNLGSGATATVRVKSTVTGIHYTTTNCGTAGTHTDGEYEGEFEVEGREGATQKGVSIE